MQCIRWVSLVHGVWSLHGWWALLLCVCSTEMGQDLCCYPSVRIKVRVRDDLSMNYAKIRFGTTWINSLILESSLTVTRIQSATLIVNKTLLPSLDFYIFFLLVWLSQSELAVKQVFPCGEIGSCSFLRAERCKHPCTCDIMQEAWGQCDEVTMNSGSSKRRAFLHKVAMKTCW